MYNMPCSVLQICWTFVQSFRDGLVFPQVVLTRLAVINIYMCLCVYIMHYLLHKLSLLSLLVTSNTEKQRQGCGTVDNVNATHYLP